MTTCRWRLSSLGRYGASQPSHARPHTVHEWKIAMLADEPDFFSGGTATIRVAYLVCQCATTVRSVVQS